MKECKFCGEEISREGRYWTTKQYSLIPASIVCQSPKSPNYRHSPK